MNAVAQIDLFLPAIQSIESLQRFLAGPTPPDPTGLKDLPRLLCADGFEISVAAGLIHHCSPRTAHGPYQTVECAFPSAITPDLMPYQVIEPGYGPEESVYHHVPLSLVVDLINLHGGLAS